MFDRILLVVPAGVVVLAVLAGVVRGAAASTLPLAQPCQHCAVGSHCQCQQQAVEHQAADVPGLGETE